MGRSHAQALRVRTPRSALSAAWASAARTTESAEIEVLALARSPFRSERYDARRNMFDWDYQMRLVNAGADIIHWYHFRDWRASGATCCAVRPVCCLAPECHRQLSSTADRYM